MSVGLESANWSGLSPGLKSFWLLDAARTGEAAAVRAALAAGAFCDPMSSSRSSALMQALAIGSAECAGLLLEAGASVEALSRDGASPLSVALASCPEMVAPLLAEGARVDRGGEARPTAASAVLGPSAAALRAVLAAGANPNARGGTGVTPFHEMAWSSRSWSHAVEMASALLEGGGRCDEPDAFGWSPLCLAAAIGRCDMALWLIDQGADDARAAGRVPRQELCCRGAEGMTPLDLARKALREGSGVTPEMSQRLVMALSALQQARELSEAARGEAASCRRKSI